jgi:hypothetical protein
VVSVLPQETIGVTIELPEESGLARGIGLILNLAPAEPQKLADLLMGAADEAMGYIGGFRFLEASSTRLIIDQMRCAIDLTAMRTPRTRATAIMPMAAVTADWGGGLKLQTSLNNKKSKWC